MTSVVQPHSTAEVQKLVKDEETGKLVVVYYTATWCMPCQQIRPKVDQLSMQYQNVSFVKVDIDELAEVAQFAGVRSVPTFEFYKKGTRVASFAGADVGKLEAFVKQHQVAGASSSSSSSGSSSTGGNGSTDGIANGMVELNSVIEKTQTSCLNQSNKNPIANVLVSSDSFLESDADEQLLMDFSFKQPVRLHSIKFVAKNAQHAPKNVKIFANKINMGFDEAESASATQEFDLTGANLKADAPALELRFVKFQRVNNVVIFVKDNQGDEDTTQLNHIKFFGQTIDATDMANLKKQEHEH